MRTTLRIPDELLRQAKLIAARSGKTLASVVEEALRESFSRRNGRRNGRRAPLPAHRARLLPGVDLDDTAGLLDLMDRPDAAD